MTLHSFFYPALASSKGEDLEGPSPWEQARMAVPVLLLIASHSVQEPEVPEVQG